MRPDQTKPDQTRPDHVLEHAVSNTITSLKWKLKQNRTILSKIR